MSISIFIDILKRIKRKIEKGGKRPPQGIIRKLLTLKEKNVIKRRNWGEINLTEDHRLCIKG